MSYNDDMESDGTSTEGYSDPSEVDLEELFVAADSDLPCTFPTWNGSEYDVPVNI